jgi:hypothetical protein
MDDSQGRLLNVSLLAGSGAHRAYYDRSGSSVSELTDPDVDDAIRTGDSARLGWYSAKGGEIGDIPVKEAGTSLPFIFREVDLADGSGAVPVQLMWSNKHDAPATHLA